MPLERSNEELAKQISSIVMNRRHGKEWCHLDKPVPKRGFKKEFNAIMRRTKRLIFPIEEIT